MFNLNRLSLKQKSWTTSRNTSILFASLDTYENKAKLLRMLELKNSSLPEEKVHSNYSFVLYSCLSLIKSIYDFIAHDRKSVTHATSDLL